MGDRAQASAVIAVWALAGVKSISIYFLFDPLYISRRADAPNVRFNPMIAKFLCVGLFVSWAGWADDPRIAFPPDQTITALDQLAITISVPAGVTQIEIDVTGKDGTPVFHKTLKKLTPGSSRSSVRLAPGVANTISFRDVAHPDVKSSIQVTQTGDESDERGN